MTTPPEFVALLILEVLYQDVLNTPPSEGGSPKRFLNHPGKYFRLVCKDWRVVHDQNALVLNLSEENRPPTLELMEQFLSKFSRVQEVFVNDPSLPYMENPYFEEQSLTPDKPMWYKALHILDPTNLLSLKIRNLGNFEIIWKEITTFTPLAKFTSLTELSFLGECSIPETLQVLTGFTNLVKLDLQGINEWFDDTMFIPLVVLTNLTTLNLTDSSLSAIGYSILPDFRALTSLILKGIDFDDDILGILSSLTGLTYIDLSDSSYVTQQDGYRTAAAHSETPEVFDQLIRSLPSTRINVLDTKGNPITFR